MLFPFFPFCFCSFVFVAKTVFFGIFASWFIFPFVALLNYLAFLAAESVASIKCSATILGGDIKTENLGEQLNKLNGHALRAVPHELYVTNKRGRSEWSLLEGVRKRITRAGFIWLVGKLRIVPATKPMSPCMYPPEVSARVGNCATYTRAPYDECWLLDGL